MEAAGDVGRRRGVSARGPGDLEARRGLRCRVGAAAATAGAGAAVGTAATAAAVKVAMVAAGS